MNKISVFIICVLTPIGAIAGPWDSFKASIGLSPEGVRNFNQYKKSFEKKLEQEMQAAEKEFDSEEYRIINAIDRYIEKNWPISQQLSFAKCLQKAPSHS
jgi:hypothetical protein